MRIAIFFTPPADHPLTRAAALWLGRDAFTGEALAQVDAGGLGAEELRSLTGEPRRYGFHATMKAPFRLSAGWRLDDVEDAFDGFCASHHAFPIGRLRVERIGGFFALVPESPVPELEALAAECVRFFDSCRAPLTEEDIARRNPDRLTPRQRENLHQWGYPYVMEDFRFHMTLTGTVPESRWSAVKQLLQKRFAPVLEEPVVVEGLSLFIEPEAEADFRVHASVAFERQPLGAA